jgi:hypothetical protein
MWSSERRLDYTMANRLLAIDRIDDIASTSVTCVVRCLRGTVSAGDSFHAGKAIAGGTLRLEVVVDTIWRYDRPVEFIDPPHVGKIYFRGPLAELIGECSQISDSEDQEKVV